MPTTLIIVAAVAILIILLATASYKACPADRVMVITGPGGRRFVSGGSAFIIPFIMRVDWLSLGAVQSLLRTDTPIPTKDAILIDVNAVANFQIASETMTVDENGKQVKALENAAKNYLNQSKERMEKDVTQVLLGKLREVIGRTELKALMENRDTFAAKWPNIWNTRENSTTRPRSASLRTKTPNYASSPQSIPLQACTGRKRITTLSATWWKTSWPIGSASSIG